MLPIWYDLTNTIAHSLCTFIGIKHISPTFMCIIPMYLRLTTFTKTIHQMSFRRYFFAIFISLWGSTHDSADCFSAHRPQLPATASNVCITDAWLGGVGRMFPLKKSWLRRCGEVMYTEPLISNVRPFSMTRMPPMPIAGLFR